MIKFWKSKKGKNIDVFLIHEKVIYITKIKEENFKDFSKQIDKNIVPQGLFSIPFSYIYKIESKFEGNEIKIFFNKDSEENFITENTEEKNIIFTYLKETMPNMSFSKSTPSFINYTKPQIFSILITIGIFIWSLYYAVQIENGVEYYLEGRAGLPAIFYSIGLLGVTKVIFLFLLLIGIGVYSLIRKNKTRSEIELLKRNGL